MGVYVALRLSGFDTAHFLGATGLRATAAPFALLAVVLSCAYHVFFLGYACRTPGKALAGLEVRTVDRFAPSWGRVILRWLCALLGVGAFGVGVAWAVFEPRRRGWADLLSGTVVALRRREANGEAGRR